MNDKQVYHPELLQKYQSHKVVRAAKIVQVNADNTMELEVRPGMIVAVTPAEKMFARYRPVAGDFYVVYEDGFASISPRAAFEEGYHPL